MTDPATISAFLTSLSFAAKFVKGSLEKIKDLAVREEVEKLLNAIIPLQSEIITLQEAYISHIREIQNLEKKLREIEDWRKEVECYELKELAPGVRVYVKKSQRGDSGPELYFCPQCFNIDHKKSMLQGSHLIEGIIRYTCLNCENTFDNR
jgi:hypothetical protein